MTNNTINNVKQKSSRPWKINYVYEIRKPLTFGEQQCTKRKAIELDRNETHIKLDIRGY